MTSFIFIILSLFIMWSIIRAVRKGEFSINESFFWVLGAFAMLILSVFPKILDKISIKIGIDYPPSLLFLICIIFLIYMNIRTSRQTNNLKQRLLEITQKLAILENDLNKKKEKK